MWITFQRTLHYEVSFLFTLFSCQLFALLYPSLETTPHLSPSLHQIKRNDHIKTGTKKRKDTTPICRTLSFWYVILLRGLTMLNSDKENYYLGIPFQEQNSLYSYAGRTSYWGTTSSGVLLFHINPC